MSYEELSSMSSYDLYILNIMKNMYSEDMVTMISIGVAKGVSLVLEQLFPKK